MACRVMAARRPQRVLQPARMPSDASRYQAQQCALPFCLADPCLPSAFPLCGVSAGSAWRPRFASASLWGARTAACKPTASGWRRSSRKCGRRCASECHAVDFLSRHPTPAKFKSVSCIPAIRSALHTTQGADWGSYCWSIYVAKYQPPRRAHALLLRQRPP